MSLFKCINPLECYPKELSAFEAKLAFLPESRWSDFLARAKKVVKDIDDVEVLKLLAIAWVKYSYLMYKIDNATSAARRKKFEQVIFQSAFLKVIALIRGYSKKAKRRKYEGFKALASKVDPRKPSNEAVSKIKVSKVARKARWVYRYGPIERCKQVLVRDIIIAHVGPSKYEYAISGKGRLKAIEEAERIIKSVKNVALGTVDFKECFASINMEAIITAIDLPVSIVENTILEKDKCKTAKLVPGIHSTSPLKKPQIQTKTGVLGLPHGSICATLIAGLVIEKILDKAKAIGLIAHVDDILVIDATKKDVAAIYKALEQISKLIYPNTPLVMKFSSPVKLGERMNFLGCWIALKGKGKNGRLNLKPSEKSIRLAYVKAAHTILESDDLEEPKKMETKLENYFKRWAGSMPFWRFRKIGYEISLINFYNSCFDRVEHARSKLNDYAKNKRISKDNLIALRLDMADLVVPEQVLETAGGDGVSCKPRKAILNFSKAFEKLVSTKINTETSDLKSVA